MAMPKDLVLVRHGESEGNVAVKAAANGDFQYHTDAYYTTPGHRWRLTGKGRAQAAAMGAYLASLGIQFDRYYVSPFVRTRETAGHLSLPGAHWRLNRAIRERDWGDIGSLTLQEFAENPVYKQNALMKELDPLYWTPPGGESIAHVAENRVRNFLSTLHREMSGKSVLAVTHGEFMWANRLVLERMDDEEFAALDANDDDPSIPIKNAEALIYKREDPVTGEMNKRLSFLRRARPVFDGERWVVHESDWMEITYQEYTSEELLEQVAKVPYLTQ